MKKIVILQDYLRNGGTERQSLHLARTFAESGCDVTLVTFRPGGALTSHAESDSAPAIFRTLTLQPFDTRLDFFAPGLHSVLRGIGPDIVLCMGRMANCKAGRIACAFPRAAIISTMRTGKTLPAPYARSLHATRHTIANSHEAARILRETYAVPAEKITVIHNAVVFGTDANQPAQAGQANPVARAASPCREIPNPNFQIPNKSQIPTHKSQNEPTHTAARQHPQHGLPNPVARTASPCGSDSDGLSGAGCQPVSPHGQDAHATQPVRLLCCAMFRPEKNQRELIEILSKLPPSPNVRLDLVGDGSAMPSCRALAQQLGVADRVHFHGFAANPALFYAGPQTAHATIAVLTSRSESLPNFLVEAHAHGIPSIAYAVGGVAECGGIAIPPGDHAAFINALTRLIAAPDAANARATESARVAAHAREHFSPETQLARYLTLFDRLA